jgi:cysteinyl-tRNA synthetase
VLGINPLAPQWQSTSSVAVRDALHNLIRRLLTQRQEARAARDFAAADRIRTELADAGILIEDGPNGSHWRIDGE